MTRRSLLGGALATAVAGAATPLFARQAGSPFRGQNAGDERQAGGIRLRWCPPGRFLMGSPADEPERRYDHIGFASSQLKRNVARMAP